MACGLVVEFATALLGCIWASDVAALLIFNVLKASDVRIRYKQYMSVVSAILINVLANTNAIHVLHCFDHIGQFFETMLMIERFPFKALEL